MYKKGSLLYVTCVQIEMASSWQECVCGEPKSSNTRPLYGNSNAEMKCVFFLSPSLGTDMHECDFVCGKCRGRFYSYMYKKYVQAKGLYWDDVLYFFSHYM